VAHVELNMSEISPIPGPSRRLMASLFRTQLEKEALGGGMTSKLWEHFYFKLDPTNTVIDRTKINKQIWATKVRMPKTPGKDYPFDELGFCTMRQYHEILIANLEKQVEDGKGRENLFRNQVIPMIWLKCVPFPHKGISERYKLGKLDKSGLRSTLKKPKEWLVPMIIGPHFRNYFVFNPIGFLWSYPLIKFNLFILFIQYTTKTPAQVLDGILSNFICYRGAKAAGIMVKQKTAKVAAFAAKVSDGVDKVADATGKPERRMSKSSTTSAVPDLSATDSFTDVSQASAGGASDMSNSREQQIVDLKKKLGSLVQAGDDLKKAHEEEKVKMQEAFEAEKKAFMAKHNIVPDLADAPSTAE